MRVGARTCACACNERVCLRVCSCLCVCSILCVRARPCAYVCLCERMCVCLCVSIGLRHRARVCSECVRAARRCARPPIARRRRSVSIALPAPRVGGRARVVAVRCDRPGSRASAAGVTWTCRTAKAPWADRHLHTSVVDAAGAIYVIGGGDGGSGIFNDVWASTDGGARPDSV